MRLEIVAHTHTEGVGLGTIYAQQVFAGVVTHIGLGALAQSVMRFSTKRAATHATATQSGVGRCNEETVGRVVEVAQLTRCLEAGVLRNQSPVVDRRAPADIPAFVMACYTANLAAAKAQGDLANRRTHCTAEIVEGDFLAARQKPKPVGVGAVFWPLLSV